MQGLAKRDMSLGDSQTLSIRQQDFQGRRNAGLGIGVGRRSWCNEQGLQEAVSFGFTSQAGW